MNKDYFKDLYTDFYGVEAGPKFAVKVIRDKDEEDNEVVEKNNQEEMSSLFDKINFLNISEENKKYKSGIEENRKSFRYRIIR